MARATPSPSPNPDAMKFTLDVEVGGPFTYTSAAEAGDNRLAAAILGVPGVKSVFGTADFVTVTRQAGADWEPIVAAVQRAVEELM